MRSKSSRPEQFFMFVSKSQRRAILVNYIKSDNRYVLWTVLPKNRELAKADTQKIYLESISECDILTLEIN
jgi:hypothetical protein